MHKRCAKSKNCTENSLHVKKKTRQKIACCEISTKRLAIKQQNTHEHFEHCKTQFKIGIRSVTVCSSNAICERIICLHLLFSNSMRSFAAYSIPNQIRWTLGIYPIFLNGFQVFSIRIIVLKSMQIFAYELQNF